MKTLYAWCVAMAVAASVSGQTVTGPTAAGFQHPASEFGITAAYRAEFFQCGSVVAGACVGRATAPFQTGSTVPKSAVTGTATARAFLFAAVPSGNPIPSIPAGVGFVMTLVAIGDPSAGGAGESARSADSPPFFGSGRTPASPTTVIVQ